MHTGYNVDFDLTALRYALVVQNCGSFRQAAQALVIQPSNVSRRVRGFEDAIGVSIFQRHSQGVQPTSAGRRILNQGLAILTDVDALVHTAALSGSGAEGQLCIGIIASIAGGKVRELLMTFISAHPGVELDVVEAAPRDHIAAVRSLRMDVALVVGAPAAPGCNVEALWSEPIFVALSGKSSLAAMTTLRWEQLAAERFIVSKADPGPDIQDIVMRHLAEFGRRPVVEPRAVLRGGLLGLVSLGVGISLVGTAEAALTYPDVVFRPLVGEVLPFSAVWADNNDNPALRRFLSLARVQTRTLASPANNAGV